MGHQRRRLVVGRPLRAVEAVAGAGIDEDLDLLAAGEGGADLGYRRLADMRVGAAEMQLQWHLDRFVEILVDAAAIVADRAIDARARRRQVGQPAAEAEAQRADLAPAFRP